MHNTYKAANVLKQLNQPPGMSSLGVNSQGNRELLHVMMSGLRLRVKD
jgi:hypothetical protein